MPIIITSDIQKAREQVPTLTDFKKDLPSDRMYFRFPAELDIEGDFRSVNFQEREKVVREVWEKKRGVVTETLGEIAAEYGLDKPQDIRAYLITLGPYGYFDPPNEVYVNIWDAPVDHVLETIVHESLHILLAAKTEGMSYEETEKFIDSQFLRPQLAETFPNYQMQRF